MRSPGPDADTRYFRIDERPYRLAVVEGETAGIDAIGFEVGDDHELAARVSRPPRILGSKGRH